MPKPSVYPEALQIHGEILERYPEGLDLPRQKMVELIVKRGKSVEAAERVLKCGKHAGLWTVVHDPAARQATVHVVPTSSVPRAPHPEATPASA